MNNIPDHIAQELERWERHSYEEEFGPEPEPEFDAEVDFYNRQEATKLWDWKRRDEEIFNYMTAPIPQTIKANTPTQP